MTMVDNLGTFMNDEESSPLSNIELIMKHEEKLSILLTFDYQYVFDLIMNVFERYSLSLRTLLDRIQHQWNERHEESLSNEESKQMTECDCDLYWIIIISSKYWMVCIAHGYHTSETTVQ